MGIERVAQRVREGGHNVNEETIRERYIRGLEILDTQALVYFDRVFIFDSGYEFELQLAIENGEIMFKRDILEMTIFEQLPTLRLMLS